MERCCGNLRIGGAGYVWGCAREGMGFGSVGVAYLSLEMAVFDDWHHRPPSSDQTPNAVCVTCPRIHEVETSSATASSTSPGKPIDLPTPKSLNPIQFMPQAERGRRTGRKRGRRRRWGGGGGRGRSSPAVGRECSKKSSEPYPLKILQAIMNYGCQLWSH